MINSQANSVIDQITRAFAGIAYPGDDNIAYDHSGKHEECNHVERHFRGKAWQDVTFEFLLDYGGDETAALSFMSPQAFRYYLPAFMIVTMTHTNDSDLLPSSLISTLTLPPEGNDLRTYKLDRFQGLTADQALAIREFLKYMKSADTDSYVYANADRALESYWSAR